MFSLDLSSKREALQPGSVLIVGEKEGGGLVFSPALGPGGAEESVSGSPVKRFHLSFLP